MRLDDERESRNVEDRRGSGGRMPVGGKGIGLGTIAIALVAMYFGVDPSVVLDIGPVSYTHLDVYKRQGVFFMLSFYSFKF